MLLATNDGWAEKVVLQSGPQAGLPDRPARSI